MASLEDGGEIIEHVADRILGRVALEDIEHPYTGEIIVKANEEIKEEHRDKIQDSGIDRVRIRSVLSCQAKRGVCSLCYGRDLAHGKWSTSARRLESLLLNPLVNPVPS